MAATESAPHFDISVASIRSSTTDSDMPTVTRTMEDDDDDVCEIYDGDYGGLYPNAAASSSNTPASTSVPSTPARPAGALDNDDKGSFVPYHVMLRKVCFTKQSLYAKGSELIALHPNVDTLFPMLSEIVLWESNDTSDSETSRQDRVQEYLLFRKRGTASWATDSATTVSSSLLSTPFKLASGAVSILTTRWHGLTGGNKLPHDSDDDDERVDQDRRVGLGDCLMNHELVGQCVTLLTRLIQTNMKDHKEAIAVYVEGTSDFSWRGWLASVAETTTVTADEQEVLTLIQQLVSNQLDFLWRVMEHDRVLERILGEENKMHPKILVFVRPHGTPQDRDYCLTRLELQSQIAALEASVAEKDATIKDLAKRAIAFKRNNQEKQALVVMKHRKMHEKLSQQLHEQLHVAQSVLHNLENARDTQGLVQVLATTTVTMRDLRTQPLRDGQTSNESAEDILDEWAEEMDNLKDMDQAFASAAANIGVENLNDDDLLAELATLPDPSGGGGGGDVVTQSINEVVENTNDPALAKLKERLAGLGVVNSLPIVTSPSDTETEAASPSLA